MLADPTLQQELGSSGYRYCMERFGAALHLDKLLECFNGAIDARMVRK